MTNAYLRPLETGLWLEQWGKVSERCALLDGEAPDAVIRKAYYLLQIAPTPVRPLTTARVTEETLEHYLECGAYLSAVAALIQPVLGVSLVRDPNAEVFLAAVRLPGRHPLGEAQHQDPAKALLSALCAAMLILAPDLLPPRNVSRPEESKTAH